MESSAPRWYFVVLPDTDPAAALAKRLPAGTGRVVPHASGRPWLIAVLPDEQIVTGVAGADRVAVLGYSTATPELLRAAAGKAGGIEALDELSHTLAGGFHLVAAIGGRLRVQGGAAGVRRVFHAVIDGVPVASDRADVLAELGGFRYDETALAIRLLQTLPHPLAEQPLWQSVEHVPPDSYLRVDADGRGTASRRWWRRPEPHLPRSAGAESLRGALINAVAARTRSGGVVHCDISGGLDSTPVTWCAAQGPAEVVAATGYNDDPGGREDLDWARLALAAMPSVRHRTWSLEDMPAFFEGVVSSTTRWDEPTAACLNEPRMTVMIEDALRHSARLYLSGLGGDQLLRGQPSWEHTLFRRHPVLAWRRARLLNRMLGRTSLATTVLGLLSRQGYPEWLREVAATARPDRAGSSDIGFNWGLPFTWPLWLTPDAVRAVRTRVDALAGAARPLGADRAGHDELWMVREGARVVRGTGRWARTPESRTRRRCWTTAWWRRAWPCGVRSGSIRWSSSR